MPHPRHPAELSSRVIPQCKAPLRCIGDDTSKPLDQTRGRINQELRKELRKELRDQLEDTLDQDDCATTTAGTTPLNDLCDQQRPRDRHDNNEESCTPDNSFDGDTPVLLADGTTTPIRNIKIGDQVLATNPETGRTEPHTVTHLIVGTGTKHLIDITVDTRDGPAVLTATGGHPFWDTTDREWVDADTLTPSDTLRTPDGHTVSVTGTREYQQHDTVYNLTVDTLHTYYVLAGTTPALVHNADPSCGPEVWTDAAWQHILDRHRPGGSDVDSRAGIFTGKSKMVRQRILETLNRAQSRPNSNDPKTGRPRPGRVYEWDFGNPVGVAGPANGGKDLTSIRVVLVEGKIVTAFPF